MNMVKVSSAGTSGEVKEQHDRVEGVAGKRYTVGKDMRLAASANDAVEELVGDFVLTDERGARLFVAMPCLCLLYTSPSPRDRTRSRMPSSA